MDLTTRQRHLARERSDELAQQLATSVASLDPGAVLDAAGRELLRRSGLPVALVGRSRGTDRLVIQTTGGTTSAG